MKSVIAEFKGESPYSQSRAFTKDDVPLLSKELPDAYEQRTWRNRMHVNPEGFVEIPGATFANCIKEAAKRLSIKIKGSGQKTYTKAFEAGVMVTDPLVLTLKAEDVKFDKLFVPSDGKPGGGKRVWKYFPRIDEWSGKVTFFIFDDVITEDVFRQVLSAAGMLVGIGRFRPQNRGFYGRFSIKSLRWQEERETLSAIAG